MTKKSEEDERIERVGELAFEYESKYGNCPQCVTAAFRDVFGFPSKDVIKAGSGLGGGLGLMGNSCGALLGAAMVVSSKKGKNYEELEKSTPMESFKMVRELCEYFESEYGSVQCKDIQKKLMGKSFDLWDKDDYEEFEAAGGHDDKCPSVAKNAAMWATKILKKRNLI